MGMVHPCFLLHLLYLLCVSNGKRTWQHFLYANLFCSSFWLILDYLLLRGKEKRNGEGRRRLDDVCVGGGAMGKETKEGGE